MSLRFQSVLQVSALPDEAIDSAFEVIMPEMTIGDMNSSNSLLSAITGAVGLNTYTPIVEEISFGTMGFKTDNRRIRTNWFQMASDIKEYSEVKITMFCSSGLLLQYYLDAWKNLVFDKDGEYFNPPEYYKRNIEVYFFGAGNIGLYASPSAHFTLVGCFPTEQENFALQYRDTPQRLRITQRFKIDSVRVDDTVANSSIISETATSPTSLIDKGITAAQSAITSNGTTASTYTMENTLN